MLTATTEIRVRYAETDAMGVVHHGSYIPYLECGRIHLLDKLDLPYVEMEKNGFRLPVLAVNLRYRQPAFFDDRLAITVIMKEPPSVRFTLHYEVKRGNTLIATGSSEHAFVDSNGQPVRPPETFKKKTQIAWNIAEMTG